MRNLLIILFTIASVAVIAQRQNAITTNTTSGRYEIVQSKLMRSLTFKIDKHYGDVYLYDESLNDSTVWFCIPREIIESDTIIKDQINYQLYLGGYVARDCFLLNLNNGLTWVFSQDEDNKYVFNLVR